jgi:hypothetical protein
MRLPGYSAELSLGRFEEPYKSYGDASGSQGQQIQPQRCVHQGNSISCTDCSDGYCWTHVIHTPTLY